MENKLNLLQFFSKKASEDENLQVVKPKTQYERDFEVSPIFSFQNSAEILAGKDTILDFESLNRAAGKYLPFNTMQILNNSSVAITIYINQKRNRPIIVPAGVIQPINSTIAPAISSLVVKNNDSSTAIAINELQFLLSKDNVTTDKLAKNIHRLLLKGVN